jgi:hypothetical protein
MKKLVLAAMTMAALALAGCVAYAPYPGYAYPSYAPAPVYGTVDIGVGFGDGWHHDGWHHWR